MSVVVGLGERPTGRDGTQARLLPGVEDLPRMIEGQLSLPLCPNQFEGLLEPCPVVPFAHLMRRILQRPFAPAQAACS